jgi:hypothetical protein
MCIIVLKMTETKPENTNQYIYLIHPREHIRLSEPVYKIGRTKQYDKRINQYPKDSELILLIKVIDCVLIETKLIKLFKNKFKQRIEFGREYFEGDQDLMIETIINEKKTFVIPDKIDEENKKLESRNKKMEEKRIVIEKIEKMKLEKIEKKKQDKLEKHKNKMEEIEKERKNKLEQIYIKRNMKIDKELESLLCDNLDFIIRENSAPLQNIIPPQEFDSPIKRIIYDNKDIENIDLNIQLNENIERTMINEY